MKLILQIFSFIILANCSTVNEVQINNSNADYRKLNHDPNITLVIENSEEKEQILLFKLTNHDTSSFLTSPLGTNYNQIILIDENGERFTREIWKKLSKPVEIKPDETKVWAYDIRPLLKYFELQNEKNIQLIWNAHGVKSSPFILNQ